MRAKDFITEANRSSVILVDFQPAYQPGDGINQPRPTATNYVEGLQSAMEYVNSKRPSVTAFFNGEEVGSEDTQHSVAEHFVEYGLDPNMLGNIKFVEKTYAFLRNWMDHDYVDTATIITTLRYMVTNNINDSREIDNEVFAQLVNNNEYLINEREDMIYLPYQINLSKLKTLSGSLIGGGGQDECLKELTILMNAFNIKYKLVNDWIYG